MNSIKPEVEVGAYVTSSRAAQLSGYSQDYVGQLCRSGSVECKRVSGEWQVNLASILAYKKRFNPNLPGELPVSNSLASTEDLTMETEGSHQDSISHKGKKYVSSADAAKVTGYSQDYIGQLARSGAVVAKKVGRKWFVEQESLQDHKDHNDGLLAAVQAGAAGVGKGSESKEVLQQDIDVHAKSSDKQDVAKEKAIHAIPIVTYRRDDGSLVPGAQSHQEESAPPTPEVKTMAQAPIRKDLRTSSLRSSVIPQGEKVEREYKRYSDKTLESNTPPKRRSKRGRPIFALLCSLLSLLFIGSAVIFPDTTITYIHSAFNSMGVTTSNHNISTESYLGQLLDKVSSFNSYKKE